MTLCASSGMCVELVGPSARSALMRVLAMFSMKLFQVLGVLWNKSDGSVWWQEKYLVGQTGASSVTLGCLTTCRSRALAIVDRLSAVQGHGLSVKRIREDDQEPQ